MPGGGEAPQKVLIKSNTQLRINPQIMKSKSKTKCQSDSEGSVESNSLSLESGNVKSVKGSSKFKTLSKQMHCSYFIVNKNDPFFIHFISNCRDK